MLLVSMLPSLCMKSPGLWPQGAALGVSGSVVVGGGVRELPPMLPPSGPNAKACAVA
jgi:hypothetical protein